MEDISFANSHSIGSDKDKFNNLLSPQFHLWWCQVYGAWGFSFAIDEWDFRLEVDDLMIPILEKICYNFHAYQELDGYTRRIV